MSAQLSPEENSRQMRELCAMAPVIPVLVIEQARHAAPLARALVAGGLPVLEVTLRTPGALDAIAQMADTRGAIVGAGTVLGPADAQAARKAGARFAVSPGATRALLAGCADIGLPLLPGAASATEVMALLERGYRVQKFFPAEPSGGAAMLRALAGPLPQVQFCPTGGIGAKNAAEYLALANCCCVGGSWVAPAALIEAQDWNAIEALARAAAAMARRP